MRGRSIRVLSASGSPVALGAAHGVAYAEEIRSYASGRVELSKTGTDWSTDRILSLAERMLPAHRSYSPDLYDETLALADAAGLEPAAAVIVSGYTDFIDVVRAEAGGTAVEDTCTAVIVPDAMAEGQGFFAQTWDMNATATPHVVMLDLHPDGKPAALVFSTVGCVGQLGMNEAGICVGINNLTADDGRIGVTWPFVVRKALEQTSLEAALTCVTEAPLAGGHNFHLFDATGAGFTVEAMPTSRTVTPLAGAPLIRTNHCLSPGGRGVEGVRPAALQLSSETRLVQAAELLGEPPVTVETLMAMTRDERSICRHPEPPFDYESCGAAIMRPATGELWACWGVPSENEYEHFELATAGSTWAS